MEILLRRPTESKMRGVLTDGLQIAAARRSAALLFCVPAPMPGLVTNSRRISRRVRKIKTKLRRVLTQPAILDRPCKTSIQGSASRSTQIERFSGVMFATAGSGDKMQNFNQRG